MALSLAEIRAQMKAKDEREQAIKDGTYTGERQVSEFLAFWNVEQNQTLNLRFLPDADNNNPYFWRERDMIKLTFNGIVGGSSETVVLQVPCNEMWVPKGCPVLKELREWYAVAKETGNKDLELQASKYWKKKSYLMQCLIAPDSAEVKNDMPPENPIRRVLLNKELFAKVKSILMNPGIRELPTHFQNGRDFSVVKTKNGGGFNTYDMSQFHMSERPLNDEEMQAIEKYGLFDLNEFMPKQPTADELNAIKEMFEASVDGQPYDPARWAMFYRPAGVPKPTGTSVPAQASIAQPSQAVQSAPVQTAQVVAAPVQEAPQPSSQSLSASDLVAKLRARQA